MSRLQVRWMRDRAMPVAVATLMATAAAVANPPPGSHPAPTVDGGSGGPRSTIGIVKVPDPNDPVEKAHAEAQRKRANVEKELKLIRAKYFRSTRNTEIRQVGLSKLREYTDPAVYPLLLELFEREDKDVRLAVLDHLIDRQSDEADAAIAWAAVFDNDQWFRKQASERLLQRARKTGDEVSHRVKSVIALGLKNHKTPVVTAAAEMAGHLKIFEAIPMLINAQVAGAGGGGGGQGGQGALAFIMVGQQIAFVSDLTPVVGDSAVAFDPTLSVATDGVVMRVIDAYVITYRIDVHNALVGLANAGWDGRDTGPLGWDQKKWHDWYTREFKPYREALAAAREREPV